MASPVYRAEIAPARRLAVRLKRELGAPGLAIPVSVGGETVWSELCGYANRASVRPVTRTTRFRVGSVSKTLTATVAARLVQRGTLDLDAPIQRYVKSFPRKRGVVSVRRLLAHTAGIRHYRGAEALSTSRYRSVSDAIRVFAADPLLVEPGTRYGYSSYGFNLVGAAIEQIDGRPFGAAVDPRPPATRAPEYRGSTTGGRPRRPSTR